MQTGQPEQIHPKQLEEGQIHTDNTPTIFDKDDDADNLLNNRYDTRVSSPAAFFAGVLVGGVGDLAFLFTANTSGMSTFAISSISTGILLGGGVAGYAGHQIYVNRHIIKDTVSNTVNSTVTNCYKGIVNVAQQARNMTTETTQRSTLLLRNT